MMKIKEFAVYNNYVRILENATLRLSPSTINIIIT